VSHIVTIQTQVRDAAAVAAACQRIGLPAPREGTTRLFSGEATGLIVELPGWRYPVVCELSTGTLKFDDFGGQWGDRRALDQFLQRYACERAKARRKGHTVTERTLGDGSIRLTIELAGGVA
jgi:hypothetical protein